jgi:hypothetical protein
VISENNCSESNAFGPSGRWTIGNCLSARFARADGDTDSAETFPINEGLSSSILRRSALRFRNCESTHLFEILSSPKERKSAVVDSGPLGKRPRASAEPVPNGGSSSLLGTIGVTAGLVQLT